MPTPSRRDTAHKLGSGVFADFDTLQTAIVMSIDAYIGKLFEVPDAHYPLFGYGIPSGAVREHRSFVRLLEQHGVEVLQVVDLLQDAIEESKRQGRFSTWVKESFPGSYAEILPHLSDVRAEDLLNVNDRLFYRRDREGRF